MKLEPLQNDRVREVNGMSVYRILQTSRLEPKFSGWLVELLAACSRRDKQSAKLAGVVFPQSGHVRLAPVLGWEEAPLAETLREATASKRCPRTSYRAPPARMLPCLG